MAVVLRCLTEFGCFRANYVTVIEVRVLDLLRYCRNNVT